MTRFPRTEPEIAAFALLVIQGLVEAAEDFPAPPISAADLQTKLDAYNAARTAAVAAESAFREAHAAKDAALKELVNGIKATVRYAEIAVRDQPEKLKRLGWSTRRDGNALQPPGEVRDITIVAEGDTWAILRWAAPADGGAPGYYRIQRKRDGTPWEDAATSTETEQLMSNQPRGVDLNYRVLAVNKAGTGQPSATVTLVL